MEAKHFIALVVAYIFGSFIFEWIISYLPLTPWQRDRVAKKVLFFFKFNTALTYTDMYVMLDEIGINITTRQFDRVLAHMTQQRKLVQNNRHFVIPKP